MTATRPSATALRLALAGLSLGYFMILFDTTALTVALPDLARDLHCTVQGLAWVTDAYTLTFAGCLLAGGVIADRWGAGRAFLIGLGGFGVLSLVCGAAPTTGALVAARALLGVAGALVLPASLSLIAALYADPSRRQKAIASWAAISGSALAAGPLLGGVLVALLGWRGIFVVNAPVAALAMFLLRSRLPAVPRRSTQIEPSGQIAVLLAVTAMTFGLIRGGSDGWGTTDVLVAFAVTVVMGGVAIRAEYRATAPAVPPALLKAPVVIGALIGGFVVGGAFTGELFLNTLQLQQLRGLGPAITGLAFLPLTIPMVLNPPVAGRIVARIGYARPVLGGLVLIAAGTLLLAVLPNDASYAWIAVGLALLGLGMSFTLPALTSAVILTATPSARGAAGGLFSVVRQTGAAVGVAATTAIIGARITNQARGHALIAIATGLAAVAWHLSNRRSLRHPQPSTQPTPRRPDSNTQKTTRIAG